MKNKIESSDYTVIREFIAEGQTDKALQIFDSYVKNTDKRSHNELIIIRAAFEDVSRKLRTRVISSEEAEVKINALNNSLLDLIHKIENKRSILNILPIRKSQNNIVIIAVIAAVFVILVTFFLFSYQIFPFNYSSADPNGEVYDLNVYELGLKIYPDYRSIYLDSLISKKYEVRKNTEKLNEKLKKISDDELDHDFKIYKYQGMVIACTILALTSEDRESQKNYSSQALAYSERAEDLIEQVNNIEDENFKKAINNWLIDDNVKNRILVKKFLASAVNYKAGGQITVDEIRLLYKKIRENNILEAEGYKNYPIVQWLHKNKVITI
jgi:hypothetical protein